MAILTKEREIGGLKFQADQLPYFRAQRLFMRLMRLAGPGLAGLFTIAGAKNVNTAVAVASDIELPKLVEMLASFFERLDPEVMEGLTIDILSTTRAWWKVGDKDPQWVPLVGGDGSRGAMDAVIGGDFWTGMMVQAWALSVHFGNFSSARGALEGLGLKAESRSAASNTSTDGKGASS